MEYYCISSIMLAKGGWYIPKNISCLKLYSRKKKESKRYWNSLSKRKREPEMNHIYSQLYK